MAKTNIRSFRFSDEVAAILEAQNGKNLNDKFENLVFFSYYKLNQRKKELDRLNLEIQETRDKLLKLQKASNELLLLEQDLKSAHSYFGIVERRAKAIADSMDNL